MPIRTITTGKQVGFEIVTELRALGPDTPNAVTSRALAEAMLQHAWARDALTAWQTLAEVTLLWRTFGDLDALEQRRIAPVIDERLRDLDDLLLVLIGEGPSALTGTLSERAGRSHAVEVDGMAYPADPETLVDATAERLRVVTDGAR